MSSYGTWEAFCIVNVFNSSHHSFDLTNLAIYWTGSYYLGGKKKKKVTNRVFLHSVIKPVLKWLTFTLKIKSQLSLALPNMA